MKIFALSIEPLEARIAPAGMVTLAVSPDGHTATYTDVDGDHVTLKISLGTLTPGLFTGVASGAGDQLQTLDMSGGGFDKASLTFSVAKVAGGDGLANVGYLNSTGHDLGAVTVKGDLGQIDAGANTVGTAALTSLSIRSMGRLDIATQSAGSPSLQSDIFGPLGALKVAGDIQTASLVVTGGANGTVGSVTIGGSLIGGAADSSGRIFSTGDMGAVKIGFDVEGGSGKNAGIETDGKLGGITIGGSLLGGSADNCGEITSGGKMGAVKIGHDVRGGSGFKSGRIASLGGTLASVTIGGSLIGGSNTDSGVIFSQGDLGALKIAHDVQGSAGTDSGLVFTFGKLASVTLGGSIIGGSNTDSGEIQSVGDMGAVKVGHDVQGGLGDDSGFIKSQAKLGSVTLGGSLIASSAPSTSGGNILSDGDMGVVKIGGDVAGGSGSNSALIDSHGKLASVTIGGSLNGGSGTASGKIFSSLDLGAVKTGHDVIGGSVTGSAALDSSGVIESFGGRIASVTIGGSIISGIDASSGALTFNATIRAANDLGALVVKGSLVGNAGDGTPGNFSPVIISARGQAAPLQAGATTDVALGKISVGGRVEFANILAGYNLSLSAVNGDAQIGVVKVGGDWAASNLVAGAMNTASGNTKFGDGDDASISAGSTNITAKIASITIGGQLFGTPASVNSTDQFGLVAQQIGTLTIGGNPIVIPTNNTPLAIGETGDVSIHIIP